MYAIASQVRDWLASGRDVSVGVLVGTRGFSSVERAACAAWADGDAVGELLPGVRRVAGRGLVEVTVADEDAAATGVSCGGGASVLVRPAVDYPAELWDRLAAREPVCLVVGSDVDLFTAASVRSAFRFGDAVPRLFGRGTSGCLVLEDGTVAVVLWPVTELVVVGDGLIAAALGAAAELLGWTWRATNSAAEAAATVAGLSLSDAVVVLSHDRSVDGPALSAALASPVGYVGALGARHIQQARAAWLTGHGVDAAAQSRIHGPAGLDIDAHTPAEIAVSIVAEILANRSSSSGGALRDRSGPVHVAGVSAPPPRY